MLKVLVLFYADDTVIMEDSETDLCNALRAMKKYCDKRKFEINCEKKTKIKIFTEEKYE